MEVSLLLLAAGRSERFGKENKLLAEIAPGIPVLSLVLANTIAASYWSKVVIVVNDETENHAARILSSLKHHAVIVQGGERRQDSVRFGLKECAGDYVLIHDCARPFASNALFKRVIDALTPDCCVIPGLPVQDTVYNTSASGDAIDVLDRSALTAVQTPQGFPLDILRELHAKQQIIENYLSDDGSIFIKSGFLVKTVLGEEENFKISTGLHIAYARFLYDLKAKETSK